MPGRIARTHTAERVSELLGTREGRKYLSDYGWAQGMPAIMAVASETLNDVMGLVSLHGRPVLIAMVDPGTDELKFLHISTPNPALQIVALEKDRTITQELFARTEQEGLVTFRVKYWHSSAVAYPIPAFSPTAEVPTYDHRFSA